MRSFARHRWVWLVLLFCCISVPSSVAQAAPRTLNEALGSLATRAAVAFMGQVVRIEHQGSVVVVSFRVDQSFIGAAGAQYQLREWAGLWPQGQVRYAVGERALVFLRAAGAGLSTPVGDSEGVLPVVVQGVGITPLVDVRRLAATVIRSLGSPLPDEQDGAVELTDILASVSGALTSSATTRFLPEPVRRPLPGAGLRGQASGTWPKLLSTGGTTASPTDPRYTGTVLEVRGAR